ncbi:MAG TPA: YheC/YheD family protein [Candidatus Saccharimonadales bacterium]|nr:YheC/YheD family protein [Candidatus Saccharimonadales bacterium]
MNSSNPNTLRLSTRLLYDELVRRDIPVTIVDPSMSLLEYTTANGETHLLFSTCSDKSPATGIIIANSKARTAIIAKRLSIPVPAQITTRTIRDVRQFLDQYETIVIKPVNGSGGQGVSTNVTLKTTPEHAYTYAKKYSSTVVAQQHIDGDDVRLLVVDGRFCSAVIRKPAHVIGDGQSSIKTLIDETNADGLRGNTEVSSLMAISQTAARHFLGDTATIIPAAGEEVRVIGPANVSLGGSLHQATHLITSEMIRDAEAITKKLGLGMCGVDMMWNRQTNDYYLIEVNATPGIDIHDDPFSGTSSDCVERYVDWLIA